MKQITSHFKGQEWLLIGAAFTSLILSFWVGVRDNVINPDGICYLLGAQYFETAGLKDVIHFCPQSQWPFYSALIFGMVKLTHLSYLHAAQLINAILSMTTVLSFILIVQTIGGSKRVILLAALAILFDHQMNVLRDNVIRDHGFWACYLLSMYVLLRFYRQPSIWLALAWSAVSLVATLFRIEGAVFFILMPLTALFATTNSFKSRFKNALMLNAPLMTVAIAGMIWLAAHPQYTLDHLGRVNELFQQMSSGFEMIMSRYHAAKTALAQYVLPPDGYADAKAVTISVWVCWYLYNVTLTFSLGYALLLLYAWFAKSSSFTREGKVVIGAAVFINVVITMAFLAEHLFISKRYLVALTLTLMIWVPFAVDHLISQWGVMKHRLFLVLTMTLVFMAAFGGIVEFGYSKTYVKQAGHWVSHNVPQQAAVYANDFQLMYYTKQYANDIYKLY
jgi:hypothetical protein